MSSSNTAFTKKLRTAICAKLQEYQTEVDEELPDYVVVLAANRKDQKQMKSDLNLFLGKHTSAFVEWLFEAFDGIQKVEGESANDKSKKSASSSLNQVSSKKSSADSRTKETSSRSNDTKKRSPSIEQISPPAKSVSKTVSSRRPRIESPTETNRSRNNQHSRTTRRSPSPIRRRARSRSPRRDESSRSRRSPRPAHRDERRTNVEDAKKRRPDTERVVDISDEEPAVSSSHQSNRSRRSVSPKVRSVVVPVEPKATTSSNGHAIKKDESKLSDVSDEEVLNVDNCEEEKPDKSTRFIIRVGDKKICRTVQLDPPDPQGANERADSAESKDEPKLTDLTRRKRHADNPANVVTRIMKAQDIKGPSEVIAARLERFGNENAKRAKTDEVVEPYSPAPVKNPSDDEAQIDEVLSKLRAQVDVQAAQPLVVPQLDFDWTQALIQQQPAFTLEEQLAMGKLGEKCRFWPNCEKGQLCPYVHPTTLCTKFPKCTFGRTCLFIHPMCKFNQHCRFGDCPYTHDIKAKSAAPIYLKAKKFTASTTYSKSVPDLKAKPDVKPADDENKSDDDTTPKSKIPCRFKNKCTNAKCEFAHPPLCRFGLGCRNRGCGFLHRKPDLKKFQWTSSVSTHD